MDHAAAGEGELKLHGVAVQASPRLRPGALCVVGVSPAGERSFSLRIAAAEFIPWDTRARHNDGPPLDPAQHPQPHHPQLPVIQTRKASPPAVPGPAGRRAPAAFRAANRSPRSAPSPVSPTSTAKPRRSAAPRAFCPSCLSLGVMCRSRAPADGPGGVFPAVPAVARPGQRHQRIMACVWICLPGSGPHPGTGSPPAGFCSPGWPGAGISGLVRELAPLHPRNSTFPGEVFLGLGAGARLGCGQPGRSDGPGGIRERFLPGCSFRGRERHQLQLAVLAAAGASRGSPA